MLHTLRIFTLFYLGLNVLYLSSCASLFKGNSQTVYLEDLPRNGLVLESYGKPLFVHTKDKKVTTSNFGFLDRDSTTVEDVTEERKTETTWIPPSKSIVQVVHPSQGQAKRIKIYCNCSLKDKGRRLHSGGGGGEVYLEPDCGSKTPKAKSTTLRTELDLLWVFINIPILGHAFDYFSGALYNYQPVNTRRICAHQR